MSDNTFAENINSSVTFLMMGDITLTWDKSRDEEVKKMIQEKMDAGYSFFQAEKKSIIRRIFGGGSTQQVELSSMNNVKGRHLIIPDSTLDVMVKDGTLKAIQGTSRSDTIQNTPAARLKTVADIIKNHTVAIAPMRGG